jgi:hypothetical protein
MRTGTPIDPLPIGGDMEGARSAVFWGWLRESSLALELIVKAAMAQKLDYREGRASVPSTHNLPQMWKMAGLPKTSSAQENHLCSAHQILQWSGRYSAPRKGSNDLYIERPNTRQPDIIPTLQMQWDNFDDLYQIAQNAYFAELDNLAY